MFTAVLILGSIGHVILWVTLVNRSHALGITRKLVHVLTIASGMALVLLPIPVAFELWRDFTPQPATGSILAWCYLAGCAAVGIGGTLQWLYYRFHPERRGVVLTNHTTTYHPAKSATAPLTAPGIPTWLARLPFNEALDIHVHEKELVIPRLSSRHAGLRIAHLSDLHMSGRICQQYFEHVVEHVNRLQPDLVAITGDIVERNPCLAWLPGTLGQLRAGGGVYYILGNHDRHVDIPRMHAVLENSGLIYLGGCWQQVVIRGARVLVAGNELPWFGPAADLESSPPADSQESPLRILLAHSPDQFQWAQDRDIDLLLAGHNHGGQVRFPLIGPVLSPSFHGVRYAAGTFRAENTVMHVSRGTSCLTPLRYNCPPEIALLILRSPN